MLTKQSNLRFWGVEENNIEQLVIIFHNKRQCIVQDIDQQLDVIFQTLQHNKLLENTYIIFTSTYGGGQSRHYVGSSQHSQYEESIHVPMIVTGPGIEKQINNTANHPARRTVRSGAAGAHSRRSNGIHHPESQAGVGDHVSYLFGIGVLSTKPKV